MFSSNVMKELRFGTRFGSIPLYIDNTSTLRVAEIGPTVRELITWLYGNS